MVGVLFDCKEEGGDGDWGGRERERERERKKEREREDTIPIVVMYTHHTAGYMYIACKYPFMQSALDIVC